MKTELSFSSEPVSLPNGTEVRVEAVVPAAEIAPAVEDFWRERSVDELIAEQRVAMARPWGDVLGQGATLWDDDVQFEDFIAGIHDRRHEGITS